MRHEAGRRGDEQEDRAAWQARLAVVLARALIEVTDQQQATEDDSARQKAA